MGCGDVPVFRVGVVLSVGEGKQSIKRPIMLLFAHASAVSSGVADAYVFTETFLKEIGRAHV